MTNFWSRVDRRGPEDCWPWLGGRCQGYGSVADGSGSSITAHRVAYAEMVGEVPPGMVLDHLCRNRLCVNPAHLEPVTNAENILRGESPTATNKRRTHCPKGHPYDETNTVVRSSGYRRCATCREADNRKRANCPQCGQDLARASLSRHMAMEVARG